jgi:O-antigen ligase
VILLAMVLTGEARIRPEYAIDRPYKSMLMALVFMYFASRPMWRRRLILSYLGGWAVFVVAALYLVFIGEAAITHQFGAPRQTVMGMNPNVQATIAASGMVLLLMEAIYHRNLWQLLAGIVGFALGGIVFVAASSRTGLAGLTAALLVAVFSTTRLAKRDRRRFILLRTIAVGVVLVGTVFWLRSHDESFFEAFASMETRTGLALSGDDTGSRKEAMVATLGVAMAHPGGVGLGRTLDYIGMDPHNGYVKIVAEGGILGLAFLLAYILVVVRDMINAAKRVEDQGAVAAFVLFSVAAASGQALVESPYWFFFAFIAFAPSPVPQRRARGA